MEAWSRGVGTAMLDNAAGALTAIVALAGIVAVILLIGRVLRYTPMARLNSSGRLLVVRESIALDARRRLYLVGYGDRSVLLLTGGGSDVVVGWVDGPPSA